MPMHEDTDPGFSSLSSQFATYRKSKLKEAGNFLKGIGVSYYKSTAGKLVVEGDINLSNKGLAKLPDLTDVIVKGNFYCDGNQLTTLWGAPRIVKGSFLCNDNRLTSLTGAPAFVGGNFGCHNNPDLASYKDGPAQVGGNIWCNGNPRMHFEGTPEKFSLLMTDHGNFYTRADIPIDLLLAPKAVPEKPATPLMAIMTRGPDAITQMLIQNGRDITSALKARTQEVLKRDVPYRPKMAKFDI